MITAFSKLTFCPTTNIVPSPLAIADTGYGIPPGDQEKIFRRNYRGKQAQGPIPGTGLGLAIVGDLVAQMGGKITVISPNNLSPKIDQPGSTFTLWLPLERV